MGILDVSEKEDLIITCESGITLRTPIITIKESGRATQGVILIRLDDQDHIAAISKIEEQGVEEVIEAENLTDGETISKEENSPENPVQSPENKEDINLSLIHI